MIDFDGLRRNVDSREDWFVDLLRARRARAGYPVGAFGRAERIAEWFASARRSQDVVDVARPRLMVFAAEHGIAEAGISAYAAADTPRLVAEVESGAGPVHELAALADATIRVVRVGDGPTQRIDRADALTEDEFDAAVMLGISVADDEIDAGTDLLMPAAIGVGASTVASALTGVILQSDPSSVTGRGSGVDDAEWMRKVVVCRDAMRRGRRYYAEPAELLRACGGYDVGALVGLLLQAAIRRTPVLLDGVVTSAAALVARDLAWSATNWWLASCVSDEPAHQRAIEAMSLEPLLDARIRVGAGASSLSALPVLRGALRAVGAVLRDVEPEPEANEADHEEPDLSFYDTPSTDEGATGDPAPDNGAADGPDVDVIGDDVSAGSQRVGGATVFRAAPESEAQPSNDESVGHEPADDRAPTAAATDDDPDSI